MVRREGFRRQLDADKDKSQLLRFTVQWFNGSMVQGSRLESPASRQQEGMKIERFEDIEAWHMKSAK